MFLWSAVKFNVHWERTQHLTLAVLVELLLYIVFHQSEILTNHNYRKTMQVELYFIDKVQLLLILLMLLPQMLLLLLHLAKFNSALFWSQFRSPRINLCSSYFMGRMSFVLLNQLHKSTRGNNKNSNITTKQEKIKKFFLSLVIRSFS